MKTVLVPRANRRTSPRSRARCARDVEFVLVDDMDRVLDRALQREGTPKEKEGAGASGRITPTEPKEGSHTPMGATPPFRRAPPRLFLPDRSRSVRILRALSQVAPHHRTDVFRATTRR